MFKLRIKKLIDFWNFLSLKTIQNFWSPNNTGKESGSIDKTICDLLGTALDALEFHNTR